MKSNKNSRCQETRLRRCLISNIDQNDNNRKEKKRIQVSISQENGCVESKGERISMSRTRSYKKAVYIREDIELDNFLSPNFCLKPSIAKSGSRSGSDTSLSSMKIKNKKRVDFV